MRSIAGRPSPLSPDDEYRECPKHGRTIFRLFGGRWRCRRCIGEAVTKRHRAMRKLLVEEAGACCAMCGYDRCEWNLHFHHVDPEQKSFSMTMASGKGLASYRAEAEKCVLLCANCHGEVEAGIVASPAPQARFAGAARN